MRKAAYMGNGRRGMQTKGDLLGLGEVKSGATAPLRLLALASGSNLFRLRLLAVRQKVGSVTRALK